MTLPPNDSAVWPIVRVLARAVVVTAGLWAFYDKMDERDIKTVLMLMFADAGMSLTGWRAVTKTQLQA